MEHSPSPPSSNKLPYQHRSPHTSPSPRAKGRKILLDSLHHDQSETNNHHNHNHEAGEISPPSSSTAVVQQQQQQQSSPSPSSKSQQQQQSSSSPSPSSHHTNNNNNNNSNTSTNAVLDAMSLSAWPSGRAGSTPDFVVVLNHYLNDQIKKIDGDDFLQRSTGEKSQSNKTNFRAVARCDVLKNCCTSFEQHFHSYRDIFSKMSSCVDVLSTAFDQHYKTVQQVEVWKQQVMKREETLRNQMKEIVEQHEREYATEAQLKKKVVEVEKQLHKTKNDLDETYRAYVRSEETLKETQERNDELSRQHVMLTLRETRMKEENNNLGRQVDVSHQHAEAKAREVGELRQDIALLNGKLFRAETKNRELESSLQTATQTLQRKTTELDEKEIEIAHLKVNQGRGGVRAAQGGGDGSSDGSSLLIESDDLNERIREAVNEKEKQMARVSTPRPDWESLFEKHETRSYLSDLVKPSETHLINRPSNNSKRNSRDSSDQQQQQSTNNNNNNNNTQQQKITSANLTVGSKRWSEMLTFALQNSIKKNAVLMEELEKKKEQADSAELKLALSHHQNVNANDHSKIGKRSQAAVNNRSLAGLVGANNNNNTNGSSSPSSSNHSPGGKSVRAGAGGPNGGGAGLSKKQAQLQKNLKNAAFVYSPISSPEYLRSTNSVPGRLWQLSDVHKVLASATDFIIAFLGSNSSNNNNQNQNLSASMSMMGGGGSPQQPLNNSFGAADIANLVSANLMNPNSSMNAAAAANIGGSPMLNTSTGSQQAHQALESSITFNSSVNNHNHHNNNNHRSPSSMGRSAGVGGGRSVMHRVSSMTETQMIQTYLDQSAKQAYQFADAFQSYLMSSFGDPATRREIAYNLIYHCRETYSNDVFCRVFLLSLGADVPADTSQRIRTFVMAFRRSFEVCDTRCSGYVSKKTMTTLIKNLMNVYSATEQKIVLGILDELPQIASRSETLVDYRVLFAPPPSSSSSSSSTSSSAPTGLWENPSRFMNLVAAIFFRAMLVDTEAAINAVKASASGASQPSRPPSSFSPMKEDTITNEKEKDKLVGDISVGSLLTALQSCDPKRDYDVHRDFVTKCIGQCSIKAARIGLDALVPRMRRNYLPRSSVFPADPRFQFPNPSLVSIDRELSDKEKLQQAKEKSSTSNSSSKDKESSNGSDV